MNRNATVVGRRADLATNTKEEKKSLFERQMLPFLASKMAEIKELDVMGSSSFG